MNENNILNKITIPIAIICVIVFRLFIDIIGWFIGNLNIESLIFNYDLKYLIFSIAELLGVLLFFFYVDKKIFIPKRTSIIYCILAIILAVLYVFSQEWLNMFYDLVFKTNYSGLINYEFRVPLINKLLLAQVIFGPISEELFFRNLIQKGLRENYNPSVVIGITSILFALIHIPDIHNMYLVFIGGLVASILYYKSKSIIPSLIFHMSWNFLVLGF